MEQKEKQDQQEMKLPYEAPRCEWIELMVEDCVLMPGNSGQINPGVDSLRGGR